MPPPHAAIGNAGTSRSGDFPTPIHWNLPHAACVGVFADAQISGGAISLTTQSALT
jgi:hypothetical protein